MSLHREPQFCHYPTWPVPGGVRLPVLPASACPYLPGRSMRSRAFFTDRLTPGTYDRLMDAGFRRSGRLIYQPVCEGCRECVPLRVDVARFRPSKSQRRVLRRNSDVTAAIEQNHPTQEKWELYGRYIRDWHGRSPEGVIEFTQFLYDSPVDSRDMAYRLPDGRLVAVGVLDVSPASMSSVYLYFDPAHRGRSLGTLSVLREIAHAAEAGYRYYYLGYRVEGCAAMDYKRNYRPHELLGPDGVWRARPDEADAITAR